MSWLKSSKTTIGSDHRTASSTTASDAEIKTLLEVMWTKFKTAPKTEDAGILLKEFVQKNYPNYQKWSPEHEPHLHAPIYSALLDPDSHKQIINLFNKYVLDLSSALTEADTTNNNELPDGLYLLYLINQMSVIPKNAKMIMQYEYTMLMQPIKVVKLANMKLKSFSGLANPATNVEFIRWWQYLEIIVANCLQTIARFANGRKWVVDITSNETDTTTPPQSPSGTPTKPPPATLHSSLGNIPTSPTTLAQFVHKSSSWSNLPLVASGSPRVEGIRIGNNSNNNNNNNTNNTHEAIRNLTGVPGYHTITNALPKTPTPSPLRINLEPELTANGPTGPTSPTSPTSPTPASVNPLSQSTGSLVTPNHTGPGSGSGSGIWSNGGSGNFTGFLTGSHGSGTWSNGGSGNFTSLMNPGGGGGSGSGAGSSGNFTLEDVDATSMLLKQGIVKALKELLKALRELNIDSGGFITLVLNTLGAVVHNSASARAKIQEDEVLAELKEWLGWRNFIHKGAPYAVLRDEFKRQILVLRVIKECIHQDSTNASRLSELGGYMSVLDVILWVSLCFEPSDAHIFTDQHAADQNQSPYAFAPLVSDTKALLTPPNFRFSGEESPKIPLVSPPIVPTFLFRSRVPELDILFGVLYAMCVIIEPSGGSNPKQSRIGNKAILSIVLESLFNEHIRQTQQNSNAREWTRSANPELQFVVLEFLLRLINETGCIEQCIAYRIWDVLFSEYFFRSGMEYSPIAAEQEFKNENNDETQDDELTEKRRTYLFTRLLVSVLQVVQFCGSLPNHDNTEECRTLLELMDTYCGNPWVILHACQCVMYLLQHNTAQSHKTFQQLPTYAVLSSLIDTYTAMKVRDREADVKISGVRFEQAHAAVIGILGCLLANQPVVSEAISDKHVPATLFTLLRDPDSESFALNTIVSLLRSTDNQALLQLLSARYIKFMGTLQEDASAHSFHLLLVLLDTIQQVVKVQHKMQKIFRVVDTFIQLVNFLNVEANPERLPDLCSAVLITLASLVAGNGKNKAYVRTFIGYDQIKNLILKAEGSVVSSTTLDILFDMIVDSKFDKESIGTCTIKNPDAVIMLFTLFPYFQFKQQAQMLDMFIPLVEFSTINQSLCCSCHLIYTLLGLIRPSQAEALTRKLAKLIEILGTHSVTVRELKRLFGLLKTEPGDFRPTVTTILLPSLQNMALKRIYGPQVYFDFDGKTSGLHLPSFERFPFPKGFTFCTWLRFESFDDPTSKPKYEPRLLSLLTDDGYGLEVYFEGGILSIHSISSSGKKPAFTTSQPTREFKERIWYFVAISYSNSRIMQSEVKVFIDGIMRKKSSLKLPQVQGSFSHCRIGTNVELQSAAHTLYRENPFYGQMGAVYMFDDVLEPKQIMSIYNLGPDYSDSFQEPGSDNTLTSKLYWNYNCRAVEGKMCVDNSPDKTLDYSLDAKIVGVNSCVTRDVKDIIHCLGGLKVLFPLFAQLSQPPSPKASMRQIDYSADPRLTVQVLGLLRDMLGSDTNQQEILRSRGIAVVGFLLQQAPPGCMDVEVVEVLSELLSIPHLPNLLKEDIFTYLFVEFRLWIYTQYEVQAALLACILGLQTERPELVRNHFGVQQILDVLRLVYWYTPDSTSLGVHPIIHPITKSVQGERPSADQVHQLRKVLSSILRVAINEQPTQAVYQTLCRALLDSQDARHVAELLEFILELLEQHYETLTNKNNSNNETPPEEGIYDHIIALGSTEFFLQLLRHEDEVVRVNCLRIISQLHTISKVYFPGAGSGSIKLSSSRKKPKAYQDCALILHILPTYPFTEAIYSALFAFTLGISYDTALRRRAEMVYDYDIKIPEGLAVILKLMLAAEVPLRQRVLEELALLLVGSPHNRSAIIGLVDWQAWFLAIYTDPTEKYKDNFEVVRELVLKIMMVLIIHAFNEEKIGWVLLERTLAIVKNCSDRGVVDAIIFSRALFGKILVGLKSDTKLLPVANNNSTIFRPLTRKSANAFIDNYVHFVARVDDHVQNVYALGKSTSPDGVWLDMNVVRDCLQITASETLNIIPAALSASRNLHTSKTKPRKTTFLYAAVTRTTLRFSLLCLSEAARMDDEQLCIDAVLKIRAVILKDLSKLDDGFDRLLLVLAHTIRLLQVLMSRDSRQVQKIFVSLMKDILRKCKPVLLTYLMEKETPGTTTEKDISHWLSDISESCTIPDFCASVASSPRWNFIAEFADASSRAMDAEDRQFAIVMERRRQKVQKELDSKIENEDKTQTATINKGDSELRSLQQTHTHPEQERRILVTQQQKELLAVVQNQWRRILRSLTNERGPWGTTGNTVHWKLDKTESLSRMRLKLKRNYKFNDHRDAVHSNTPLLLDRERRKTGDFSSDFPSDFPEELLSGIKLTDIGVDGDATDDVIDNTEDGKEEVTDAKAIFTAAAELVTPMNVTKGVLQITQTHLVFTSETSDGGKRDRIWAIDEIVDIHLRRYLLRRSALEIFLADHTNYFLNFKKRDRNKVYTKIYNLNPNLSTGLNKPEDVLKRSGIQQKWQTRKISNFDYLMQLNTVAGRTYNDLTQYPVFPWVIADYTSTTLDLNNPATYRDLSKPIGALTPDRLTTFLERYQSFDDPNIPKFHYGSHYSSAGTTLFYLVRMEPFTTLFLKLQGGKFDHADRMFDSIPNTWKNCLHASADVKELIPEFFYMPEFLLNSNNFNFGVKQTGVPLGDVQLPPWAATPQDFVRINREALESEYVSAHLHEWIDLIFGYKQRGRAAVESYNVFYYLTYEGSVDIDKITDPDLRRATESQIDNFGQTPAQLIKKRPHPARLPPSDAQISIFRKPDELQAYYMQISKSSVIYIGVPELSPNNLSSSGNTGTTDKILTIDRSRTPAIHKWFPQMPLGQVSPFTFELDQQISSRRRVGVPFARDIAPSPICFAVTNDGRAILSCGHWDNSFKISNAESSKLIQSVAKHKDIVTCLALGSDNQTLVTGSRDTTLMVWDIISKGSGSKVEEVPRHILYGHDDEITCVAVNVELDIAVSGSKDGTCVVHSLREGEYVRTINLPKASPVNLVAISPLGYIVVYSQTDLVIYLYSINGKLLKTSEESERLNHILITRDSEYLITGGEKGMIVLRSFYNLKTLPTKLSVDSTIFALAMTPDERHLLVGLEEGKLLIITARPTPHTE